MCLEHVQSSGDILYHLYVRGRRHRAMDVRAVKSKEKWDSTSSEELLKVKIHFQGYQFMAMHLFILESSERVWKTERNLVCNKGGISN